MAVLDVKDIARKRNTITSKIKAIRKKAEDHGTTPLSVENVEIHLQSIQDYIQDANDLHNQILEECTDDSLIDAHIEMVVNHEEQANEVKALLFAIKSKLQPKVDPATSAKITELKRKRDLIYTNLTAMQTRVNDHATNPISLEFAECDLAKLQQLEVTADNVMFEILSLISSSHVAQETANQQKIAVIVREIQASLSLIIKEALPKSASTGGSVDNSNGHIRLPVIQLPSFDGKYENWTSFKDMFTATVDSNASLSGAQKLQYLNASLKGEAAMLIKAMQITDDNYNQAWVTVNERYENKREILGALMNRVFEQPIATKESASELQRLLDTTTECKSSLKVLGRPMSDDTYVHLVNRKLDPETRRRWVMSLTINEIPDFKKLSDFLKQTIRGLQADSTSSSSSTQSSSRGQSFYNKSKFSNSGGKKFTHQASASASFSCLLCKGDHPLHKCAKFLNMDPGKRVNVAKEHSLCANCLRRGHSSHQCKNKFKCRKCNRAHHTLLHMDQPQSTDSGSHHEASTVSVVTSNYAGGTQEVRVLLATAVVDIMDNRGFMHQCRVLLDGGSETSLISENCIARLGLSRKASNVIVKGIGNSNSTPARGQVSMSLYSRVKKVKIEVDALILPKVTGRIPSVKFTTRNWPHIQGLQLADQTYHTPGPIDVLLGADQVAAVFEAGKRSGQRNTPTALETIFGWVLMGRVASESTTEVRIHHCQVEQILQKFWEVEDMPKVKHYTKEEKACEEHFVKTVSRKPDGRYVVRLPTKDCISKLGESRNTALKRLQQVQRRLEIDPDRKKQYSKFMQEFIDLGHMRAAKPSDNRPGPVYYLPHHCVVKDSSTTTKLRVVFDGSAKSTSGLSLNDCLMVGPTVQDDLYVLLIRFRIHLVALKADIVKMYRQFEVAEADQNLQRILWTADDGRVSEFIILVAVYGTAAAPFLATRCLKKLAEDEEENYPVASKVLDKQFYVDDLMGGESSTATAIHLQQQLTAIIKAGAMELTKWASNSEEVMATIPASSRESLEALTLDSDHHSGVIKALGVCWHPKSDEFSFRGFKLQPHRKLTKRIMLSELARVFDPLGLLSPFTIGAKILFQELWKEKLEWDTDLRPDLREKWNNYIQDLEIISTIRIPRCLITSTPEFVELHGFCDGSQSAYGAVIYYKSKMPDGSTTVRLITSKSKVAPVKTISVPKLELCGAVMLAKLITTVKEAIEFRGSMLLWSDSETVLKWLAKDASRWKTFTANRVAQIHELTNTEDWRYVNTLENPADKVTRGISALELQNCKLWWSGPDWLEGDEYPTKAFSGNDAAAEEERGVKTLKVVTEHTLSLWNRYSSFKILRRDTAT
jgi:hypothetical protein